MKNLICLVLLMLSAFARVYAVDYVPVRLQTVALKNPVLGIVWKNQSLKLAEELYLDFYKQHGSRDAAWNADAEKLIGNWTKHMSGLSSDLNKARLYWLAKKIDKLGTCTDPIVYYCIGRSYGLYYQWGDMQVAYQRARELFADHACPLICKAHICRHLADVYEIYQSRNEKQQSKLEQYVKEYVQHMDEAYAAGEFKGNDRWLLTHVTDDLIMDPAGLKIIIDGAEALSQKIDSEWAAEYLSGWAHVKWAWYYRGYDWGNTVTDEGWAGFHKHLAIAEEKLTHAWTLNPSSPIAAVEMITVAMGSKTHVSQREWFDRAIAAEFDCPEAYSDYTEAIMPRWGGSHQQMLDFGQECYDTKKYDTFVPMYLVWEIRNIYKESVDFNNPQVAEDLFKQKRLWSLVEEVLKAKTEQRDPNRFKRYYRSYYVALAYRFGELATASAAADDMNNKFDEEVFGYFQMENVNLHADFVDPLDDL